MMKFDNSFPKSEKLTHQRLFDSLFKKGQKVFQHPLLGFWSVVQQPDNSPIQVGFSVSKKRVKKAHDRNQIKRWLREAYRTQNQDLKVALNEKNKQIVILLVIVKSDNISFDLLQSKIKLLLTEITEQVINAE